MDSMYLSTMDMCVFVSPNYHSTYEEMFWREDFTIRKIVDLDLIELRLHLEDGESSERRMILHTDLSNKVKYTWEILEDEISKYRFYTELGIPGVSNGGSNFIFFNFDESTINDVARLLTSEYPENIHLGSEIEKIISSEET